jgi:hypothetical protein
MAANYETASMTEDDIINLFVPASSQGLIDLELKMHIFYKYMWLTGANPLGA